MTSKVVPPSMFEWVTRPHAPGEPARHVAELSDEVGIVHSRCNIWRYEPGARGRRHVHAQQEETFVVLTGTLTMYLGDPPERRDVPVGGVVHTSPATPLQTVNHGDVELRVYVHGSPPDEGADVLDSAI